MFMSIVLGVINFVCALQIVCWPLVIEEILLEATDGRLSEPHVENLT